MKRLWLCASVALWSCHPSAAAPGQAALPKRSGGAIENLFARDEQSTSFVHQALLSCMSGIGQAEAALPAKQALKAHVKTWYCVCMVDGLGVSKRPAVSAEQAGPRCVDFASHATRKTATSTRTPYSGNSFLNVSQMADALAGCRKKLEQEPKTATLAELQKETFCSCVVDSMRFRRTTSTNVPLAETRTCAKAAGWSW